MFFRIGKYSMRFEYTPASGVAKTWGAIARNCWNEVYSSSDSMAGSGVFVARVANG